MHLLHPEAIINRTEQLVWSLSGCPRRWRSNNALFSNHWPLSDTCSWKAYADMCHLMLCVPGICHNHWLVYRLGSCHVDAESYTRRRVACRLMASVRVRFRGARPPPLQVQRRFLYGAKEARDTEDETKQDGDRTRFSVGGRKGMHSENCPLFSGRLFYSNDDIGPSLQTAQGCNRKTCLT